MMCAHVWGEDAHEMGVSMCMPLCGVRIPMRWVCHSSLIDETMCTLVWGEGAHVMGVHQTLD
jgi:hypothetical protein